LQQRCQSSTAPWVLEGLRSASHYVYVKIVNKVFYPACGSMFVSARACPVTQVDRSDRGLSFADVRDLRQRNDGQRGIPICEYTSDLAHPEQHQTMKFYTLVIFNVQDSNVERNPSLVGHCFPFFRTRPTYAPLCLPLMTLCQCCIAALVTCM
jgi:hypothetical protein